LAFIIRTYHDARSSECQSNKYIVHDMTHCISYLYLNYKCTEYAALKFSMPFLSYKLNN